jgi:hypothetical protein
MLGLSKVKDHVSGVLPQKFVRNKLGAWLSVEVEEEGWEEEELMGERVN